MPSNKLPNIPVNGRTIQLPEGASVRWVSPPAVFRITENGVKQGGEGGRISISADNTEDDRMTEDMKLVAATLMLNFRKDEPMSAFPEPADAGATRWSVILVEHAPGT